MPRPAPIIVDFPLCGEWTAYHTPAERVPSHGTDQLAQRYAYDFLRIDHGAKGWKFHRASSLRYHVLGSPLRDCFGWGQSIHAPFAGTVVTVRDGWPERDPVHFVRDLAVVIKHAFTFDPRKPDGLFRVLGNHVIVKMRGPSSGEPPRAARRRRSALAQAPEGFAKALSEGRREVYALIAHARTGSLRVEAGQEVDRGQHVADVGHSGNSTAPHLHFHLMDNPDVLHAQGLPCAFTGYEAFRDGRWHVVTAGMPGKRELVRRAG